MQHFYVLFATALLTGAAPASAALPAESCIASTSPNHPITHPTPDDAVGGRVRGEEGEPLPGATIFIKGSFVGTSTNQLGQFHLKLPFDKGPVTLVVSFLGYESREITLSEADHELVIDLEPSPAAVNATVVSASRVEENILRTSVTIDKVTSAQIEKISTPEVLAGLGQLPGVDVNSASMLFTSVSTRGFNTAKSERVIQLVDYMDTALPSLNLSPGNLVGIPELDMESIELIHGPASALYGANALSGVVLFNSKDPFVYEGLSVRLRGGQRSMVDGQLRYAKKLGKKLAVKFNASGFQATDWIATNREAASFSVNPAGSPLGYDAVSSYGEISFQYSPSARQQMPGGTHPDLYGKTVYMPGFTEQELIGPDQKTRSYRVQGAVAYLLKDNLQLTLEAKYATGTSTYQNISRFRVKDLGTKQYRAELKSNRGFIRAYSTEDFTGSSYELTQLSALLLNSPAPVNTPYGTLSYAQLYFSTYNTAYKQAIQQPGATREQAQALAQQAANATQLKASDPRFGELRTQLIANDVPGQGAQQRLNSFLNDISTQRSFRVSDFGTDLIVGGAYREYRLGSGGKLFRDTDGQRLRNYEFGAYSQLTQTGLHDHLKLALAARVDYFQNFSPALSPRASAVYSFGPDKRHNFRGSYAAAYRSPSQLEQYGQSDVTTFIVLGNIGRGFQGYGFTDAAGHPYGTPGIPLSAFEITLPKLKLEHAQTLEIGYKGMLLPKLYADVSYFRSLYHDFVGAKTFVGNVDGSRPSQQQLDEGLPTLADRSKPTRFIFSWYNHDQQVRTQGATLGLAYQLHKALSLNGNYSLNVLDRRHLPTDFQTFFNTPKHKFNVGATGTAAPNLTYALNYRWAEGHRQEMPFASGTVRSYSSTDAYLGYTLPKLSTTFQAGVSNLFNTNNIQIIGGPQIGRLAFLGVLVNVK
ncbi:TonB-dependent receptor [Hymenobacter chitinivorans]|uniref:TonB-dependent receptor-like protein n=1 Tax=Hymenobacter chitinivorans DSM 11115 TaxID=1121954 RepID=A0A2M9BPL8_9BACT|nr:TonB-dependent receptor [Hymenobacter chitinivorans]PJJ59877.1 TonB-dependent receptor-like protein [Hymenobacter chitinivorans DSM 11115]